MARTSPLARRRLSLVLGCAALLFLPSLPAHAQRTETLLGRRGVTDVGGFGGPVVKFSRLAGTDAVFSGGRGGLIVNRRLVLGGGGYGSLSENIRTDYTFDDGSRPSLRLGYGGLELEYIMRPTRVVHGSIGLLIGGGVARYETKTESANAVATQTLESTLFVAEPALNLEVNVTSWFRTGVGAGYRYVHGSDLPLAGDSQLSAAVGTLFFRFGSF